MKNIAIALLFLPVLATAQSSVWTRTSAIACYSEKNSKTELMEAIACLKKNPIANAVTVKEFRKKKSELFAGDGQLIAALDDLDRQKNAKLYVSYRSNTKSPSLMVVDSMTLGGQPALLVADPYALDMRFTHTSVIFGADKTLAWTQVRSFRYQQSGNTSGIGELVTTLVDGTQIVDKKYQGGYPLKEHEASDYWRSVAQLNGITYPGGNKNETLRMGQNDLSSYEITFLTEEEGKLQVARFEEEIAAQQKAKEHDERIATERRQIASEKERARKALLLTEMSKAARGTEDSCKRIEFGTYMVKMDPDYVEIECQFGGTINLTDLKGAGWLVVNKQKDSEGIVREYYIRKAR